MPIVVAVNLRMAFKANRNRIVDVVCPIFLAWNNVVSFDLDSTEAMANTATPVTSTEKARNFISLKWHLRAPFEAIWLGERGEQS